MNLSVFPVSMTNIFPAANSRAGGQLLSEFNMRSRESVATDQAVNYMIGPSYTHSPYDFIMSGANTSELTIHSGRALINGYYFELLEDVSIDLAAYNDYARNNDLETLPSGILGVGLKAVYSTDQSNQSTYFSLKIENQETGYYDGIQLVLLPDSELKLPSDVPDDESKVKAHLKLGTIQFNASSGTISSVNSYTDSKIRMIPANRIGDIQGITDSTYVTKTDLNPSKLYVFSGLAQDWCTANESLMVWDRDPTFSTNEPTVKEATFVVDTETDNVYLDIPHKQLSETTQLLSQGGDRLWMQNKRLKLPVANFGLKTAGIVNNKFITDFSNYVSNDTLNKIYTLFETGHMVLVLDYLDEDRSQLNELDPATLAWHDYVLVIEDHSQVSEDGYFPSTIYVAQYGYVTAVNEIWNRNKLPDGNIPVTAKYIQIASDLMEQISISESALKSLATNPENASYNARLEALRMAGYYPYFMHFILDPEDPSVASKFPIGETDADKTARQDYVVDTLVKGITDLNPNAYCRVDYKIGVDSNNKDIYHYYYYQYIDYDKDGARFDLEHPVRITGNIHLATSTNIGGFYNNDAIGYGYVGLDENGYLRVNDFDLLASGVQAYALNRPYTLPGDANGGITSIQGDLNNLVNERIAFANYVGSITDENTDGIDDIDSSRIEYDYETYPCIEITINLSEPSESENVLNINRIDSRFDTYVLFKFVGGSATAPIDYSGLTINFSDCQKIRIDTSSIFGNKPIINLYRCGLYYDPEILNDLNYIEGLSLWHDILEVDGLTVRRSVIVSDNTMGDIDFWGDNVSGRGDENLRIPIEETDYSNDNHFKYALESISFDTYGNVSGLGFLIGCESTINVVPDSTYIINVPIKLPQGSVLGYPISRFTSPVKVCGTFISAYPTSTEAIEYLVSDNDFTMLTSTFDSETYSSDSDNIEMDAILTIFQKSYKVNTVYGLYAGQSVDAWKTGSYHLFYGGRV